jgi:competence protein ComEC
MMSATEAPPQLTRWNLTPLFWLSLAFLSGIILASSLKLSTRTWLLFSAASLSLLAIPYFISLSLRVLFTKQSPAKSFCVAHEERPAFLIDRFFSHISTIRLSRISELRDILSGIWTRICQKFPGFSLPLHPAFLLAVAALGAARYQSYQPVLSPASIAFYNDAGQEYILEGIVIKPPDYRDTQTNLVIRVDRLRPTYEYRFTDVDGLLLAKVTAENKWHYGDLVRLQGEIRTPAVSEDFSYRDYLARRGILSFMSFPSGTLIEHRKGNPILNAIFSFRERAYDTIYSLFPDPEASLFAGILLGMDGSIPTPVEKAFITTGTSHIIAISGFNITIISVLLAMIFGRLLGRWRAAVATIIGITFYTILVGADAAVVRAAILGGLSLLAAQLGRRQAGLNSLAIIAAVMALANPNVPWDLSFQLSFTATLGMILYAEMLSEGFERFASRWFSQSTLQRIAAPVSEYLLITLAAQVLTIPVIAYHFHRISLISLIANPAILPAQPPLMILGGIATIIGMILLPVGKIIAALAWPFALYTIRLVEFFAHIPKGEILLGDISLLLIILFYAVLFTVTFPGKKVKDLLQQIKPGVPLAGLFIFTILIWQLVFTQPDSRLHMSLLNVSTQERSGHAILLITPSGRRVLVNGGYFTSLLSDALGRRLPWADRKLDWLVVANTNSDELAALPRTIERYHPDNVLWAGTTHGNSVSRNLWESLTTAQIPVTIAEAGHALELGDNAQLRVLSVNRRGAVLLLEWHNFRALLPLGLDLDYIEGTDFGREIGAVNVLLLAESGYLPVNPPEWITNLDPQLILLSVTADDYTGLPSPETIQAIQDYSVLRTDLNGWIELTTDGEQMWVEVERK